MSPSPGKLPSLIVVLILLLLLTGGTVPAGTHVLADETSRQFALDNGLKVFLLEKRNFPLVNVVAAVNLGTKDETAATSGLVHVLEHCILFRGTEHRSGSEVERDVRRHGGYFNAHTGQDLALFELTVPAEHAEFALANQKDILFNLKLTQQELDREKEVVLEEFNQMEDDPFLQATSIAYKSLFSGHAYGNPPHGDKTIIQGLTAETVEEFYRKYCVPENCSLAVVGDFGLKEMEDNVRRVFGEIKGVAPERPAIEPAPALEKPVRVEIEMDVKKAYLVIAALAPDYNSPDQYTSDVLTEILGRGVNPMLFRALWGRRKLVETVSMSYHAHKHGGAFLTYLTLDPKDIRSAERETVNFLKKVRDENFSPEDVFGEEQLHAFDFLGGAKNRIRYAAQQSQEKGLSLATSLARFMLLSDGQEGRNYLESIDQVKTTDLRKAAAKYFGRGEFVVVAVLPKEKNHHDPEKK
jgi:predicted Zn-dependent peptidase